MSLNFSGLLAEGVYNSPVPIEDAVHDRVEALLRLVGGSAKLSSVYVPGTLTSALVLVSVTALFSLCLAPGWLPYVAAALCKLKTYLRVLALLALSLICCSPLILLASILYKVLRAADELPS